MCSSVLFYSYQNGLYSALPYITMFVVANTISNIVDRLRERGTLSTAAARKLAMMMGKVICIPLRNFDTFIVLLGHLAILFNGAPKHEAYWCGRG